MERLRTLIADTWRAEPIKRGHPLLLLPDENGRQSGDAIAPDSREFAQWLQARYAKQWGETPSPDALRACVCGLDFQMRIGATGRAKR